MKKELDFKQELRYAIDMKEEKDICDVCDKVVKDRKLFLSKRDDSTLSLSTICLCETCFYRLPYDLQPEVIKASQNQDDEKIGPIIVSSLNSIYGITNLNQGWVVLLKNHISKFEKFGGLNTLLEKVWIESDSRNQTVCTIFHNGRIVSDKEIEKKIKSKRKRMGLVATKRDLICS